MSPYDELIAFTEREAELIRTGAWAELAAAPPVRLPETTSRGAGPALERSLAQLAENASALAAAMAQTRGELDAAARTRRTLGSYSRAPRPRLDFRG